MSVLMESKGVSPYGIQKCLYLWGPKASVLVGSKSVRPYEVQKRPSLWGPKVSVRMGSESTRPSGIQKRPSVDMSNLSMPVRPWGGYTVCFYKHFFVHFCLFLLFSRFVVNLQKVLKNCKMY